MKPDFEKIATLLSSNNIFNSVSELHGIISGQMCAGGKVGDVILIWQLLGQETKPGKLFSELIERLQVYIQEQLRAEDYIFQPLLPDDDEEISIRLHALGNWCDGFVSGFGGAYAKSDSSLLEETREALKDFTVIAKVDDSQLTPTEKDEQDYMEVTEYVRMAACSVFIQNNVNKPNLTSETTDINNLH